MTAGMLGVLVAGLAATEPRAELADKLSLYGQFVGEWDVRVVSHASDGGRRERTGEWNFGWVLEGRAVQDVFIVPARGARRAADGTVKESYGTTLRFYDPDQHAWQITYVDPVYHAVSRFIARQQGDEIVQEGTTPDGQPSRWVFSKITPVSFDWRSEASADGGKTWKLEQEIFARRKTRREVTLLDAPSNLGLRPLYPGHIPSAARAPSALRAHDLLNRIRATDCGSVPAPAYDPNEAPRFGFRNGEKLVAYSSQLARRLGELVDPTRLVVLIGGDCSVLVGSALALKRKGRYGLLFVDGHIDYAFPRDPERVARNGMTAAGLDLGLATGFGPEELANIDGLGPYLREEDVVLVGYRQTAPPDTYEMAPWERSLLHKLPLERVRQLGPIAAVQDALRRLERADLEGFWVHVDVDVLDPRWMPAVDSPDPGGLRFEELEAILQAALHSKRAVGLELTIFDPDQDPDGRLAHQLVDLLARALTPAE
ncbi:MAG: arginase family protein [Thermoanaerobaculia bacterium]